MRNVLILGAGRSGTSMVAGLLAKSGYFMGDSLWPARKSNPKGFFEDREINRINEDILDSLAPKKLNIFGIKLFGNQPNYWDRWLLKLPAGKRLPPPSPSLVQSIRNVTTNEPFCFKDPRFCYTIPIWRPFLKDVCYICIFREPFRTAKSIVKECHDVRRLRKTINISYSDALNIWQLMYTHVTQIHRHEGEWLFLHYNQMLFGNGMDHLERFTGATVDRSFVDRSLSCAYAPEPIPEKVKDLYEELCSIAGYSKH